MRPETVFLILNNVALAGWVLLVFLPRQRWAMRVSRWAIPVLLASAYVAILAAAGPSEGGFSTLEGVATLFMNPWLLLAGWTHYLAFDLLIGHWEARDAQERGIRHLFIVPSLLLTFVLGPAGWLSYLALRTWRTPRLHVAA